LKLVLNSLVSLTHLTKPKVDRRENGQQELWIPKQACSPTYPSLLKMLDLRMTAGLWLVKSTLHGWWPFCVVQTLLLPILKKPCYVKAKKREKISSLFLFSRRLLWLSIYFKGKKTLQ
jgi:hypothetical protein